MIQKSYIFSLGVIAVLAFPIAVLSQDKPATPNNTLYKAFQNPSNAARPRVWWHWMNGNISKDGIRKDLLWMHRSGIGGFQNFDAGMATPQVVAKRLTYMTPAWQDAFRYTTKLADSLKLEMAIAGSPGWSESGGPWVKPEEGMKKYVWTVTRLREGATRIRLPKPPGTTGTFQNLPMQVELGDVVERPAPPVFYQDVSVIAYKILQDDKTLAELNAVVTASSGNFSLQQLTDGDLATPGLLPSDTTKGYAWIQFQFPQPQTIRAITIVGGGNKGPFGLFGELKDTRSLEVSEDGKNYRWVCYLPAGNVLQQTIAIPATRANYFRITFKNPPTPPDLAALFGIPGMPPPKAPLGTDVAELVLSPGARVHMFEEKAAFAAADGLAAKSTPASPSAISPSEIIDLTNKMNDDGTLNWTVPPGNWKIIRLGYSLLGITNHPASPEATGLEVDKLDPAAIKNYFTQYLEQYKKATGGLMGNNGGLQYMVTDSWEAGAQNWTPNLPDEFLKRRGYSLLPWIPVLTGELIKSAEASDRFLWDFRKTLSEMLAEYHYDGLTNILQQYGMKRYSESHEDRRALIADGMDVKRTAAVPMSAMWMPRFEGDERTAYIADIRESASVAHIYGQNMVAAESFTAGGMGGRAFSYAPEQLKSTADLELANGLNRFVVHTSVHQPLDQKPGLGLASVGQWFTRHETWAEQAKAWTDYLARSSYLLQQGKSVADVVYYYGEDNNITALFGKKLPGVPAGYNYDFINPHALINLLSVKDGKLATPSGMSYRVLHLDSNARQMSLPVLRKIARLVREGAVISGVKPESTPSLSDDPQEFERLVGEVWGSAKTIVYTDKTVGEVLTSLNIQPDFTYTKPQSNTQLLYVHRKLADSDIYWVNNRNDRSETIETTFRMTGKVPQLWHPETGLTEPVSYSIVAGRTRVSLPLSPNDAVFVVFQTPATQIVSTLPQKAEKEIGIEGPWSVSFQPNRGAPGSATFNNLASFTENSNAGIKYFSGTATYTKSINVPADVLAKGAQVWLDLGEVKNLAEVVINGKLLGVVWKKPFRVDVSNALKGGDNTIEINVTNLWVNRLIGDTQPGVISKITYTSMPFYQTNSPLQPSGLLGPVKLVSMKSQ